MPDAPFTIFLGVTYEQTAFRTLRHEYNSRNYALRKLGYEGSERGYDRYLASSDWKDRGRATYQRSSRPQRCYVCGADRYDVHHRTYKSLGRERLDHLVALCRRHHASVHTLAEHLGRSLFYSHDIERMQYIKNRVSFPSTSTQ